MYQHLNLVGLIWPEQILWVQVKQALSVVIHTYIKNKQKSSMFIVNKVHLSGILRV